MITLIARYQDKEMLDKLLTSAKEKSLGCFDCLLEKSDGLPHMSKTYNELALKAKGDILCFVHDDVEFLSNDWDREVEEIFEEYKPDILGVVGATRYYGGRVFDAGNPFLAGHVAVDKDGEHYVKILSKRNRYFPVKVVDGLIMFVSKKFVLANPFDETLDELFFYDLDLCLRAEKVGITSNVFVRHAKPQRLYGVYPENLSPIENYWSYFHKKHFLNPGRQGDQSCSMVPFDKFDPYKQNFLYEEFCKKYNVGAPA